MPDSAFCEAPSPPLCSSELHFQQLLEKVPAGAYTCDADGLITYYNQRAVRLWGRAPKLKHPEDRFCGSFRLFDTNGSPIAHDTCWMALALKEEREYNGHEIIVERPNGERVTVLAHANPIWDEFGRVRGAVNVLVDITRQKQSENLLKEADRRKIEFLAMLAHELRNPVAAIRHALEVAKLSESSEGDTEWAKGVVDRQSAQLGRLVDDLLDVSRLSLGKVRLDRRNIDVAAILDRAVEATRPLISERKHELSTAYDGDLAVHADPARLEQIVTNLLTNAAKYTPAGGSIRLTARRTDTNVIISVKDTGLGISPEKLPAMFELFTQGQRSLDRSEGGLGLGLTIVRNLAEMHGGAVTARSEGVGKGCEFTVTLPAVDSAVVSLIEILGAENRPAPRSLRVLVVDDNRDTAEGMARLLRHKGHTVEAVHEGWSAIEKARTLKPQAVLLDLGLPGMDGYELISHLRQERHCDGAIFIAISGYGQEDDRRHSQEAGFHHHLVKPVDMQDLGRLLMSPG